MERESVKRREKESQGDAGFLRVRRGSRVAGLANARITDAGIADAGFASHGCHNARFETCVQVRT